MIKDSLSFLLIYTLISAVPALVLLARGRGWRPRHLAISFLVSWTGGGWLIMLWIAVLERSSSFLASTPVINTKKNPAKRGR